MITVLAGADLIVFASGIGLDPSSWGSINR
jgi:hypothetical protein